MSRTYKRITMIYQAVWQTYFDLGSTAYRNGRPDIAEAMLQAALNVTQSSDQAQHDIADKVFNLATLYCEQRRLRKGLALFKEALSIYQRALGADHPRTLKALHAVAAIYMENRKPARAKAYYEKALAVSDRCSKEDPLLLSEIMMRLSLIYMGERRHRDAQELYQRAVALRIQQASS